MGSYQEESHVQVTVKTFYYIVTNVLKTESMAELEKLPIHGLWTEPKVELGSNRIKPGPEMSQIDSPIGWIDRFDSIFKTLILAKCLVFKKKKKKNYPLHKINYMIPSTI